jgi:hypothetical protein
MMRSMLSRGFALFGFAFVASSCSLFGGDDKQGSFTISVSDAAINIFQSVIDTVTVTITRSDYSDAVTLTLSGVPAGVSATFTPALVQSPGQSSLLVLTASGTAAVGVATVTVNANGVGATEQSTTFQLTIGVTGTYTLGAQGAPIVAAQGGGGSATVLITRTGGHADNVSLSVSGAPSGVTASVAPSPTSNSGATISVTAAAGVAVGTYPLTITGVAAGLTDKTTQVNLEIIAAPSTASLVMPFCPTRIPVFFAIRNQGYGWQNVSPAGATFTFQATEKLAIAYTLSFTDRTEVHTLYVSRAEMGGWSDRDCLGPKTITGSVVGAAPGQSARIAMGASSITPTQASPAFTLTGVADRVLDVVGTKGTFVTNSGGQLVVTPDKLLLRRAQNPANNTSLGNLDFGGVEAFDPASNTIGIGNTLSGDSFYTVSTLLTGTNTYGTMGSSVPPANAVSFLAYSVPGAKLVAGDVHELYIEANQPGTTTYFTARSLASYVGALTDHTETLGPLLSTPTTTTLSTTPYVRFRGQLPVQADYPTATRFLYVEEGTTQDRLVFLWMTAGYLGATPVGNWDVVTPDFTGVSGFQSGWMLQNEDALYQVDALSGSGAVLFNTVPAAGQVVKGSLRVQYTDVIVGAGIGTVRGAVQYLRR